MSPSSIPCAHEDRDRVEELSVLLTHQLVGSWTRQTERGIETLECFVAHPDLFAVFLERELRARRAATAHLHIPEREIAGGKGGRDSVFVDPHPIELEHDPCAEHRGARICGSIVALEYAELRKTADVLRCRTDAFRDLGLAEAVVDQETYSLGFATNASWHDCEQK